MELQRLYGYRFGLVQRLSRLYQELEYVNNEISIADQKSDMLEDMEAREMADNVEYDLTTDDFVESWIEDSVNHMHEIDDSEIEELE